MAAPGNPGGASRPVKPERSQTRPPSTASTMTIKPLTTTIFPSPVQHAHGRTEASGGDIARKHSVSSQGGGGVSSDELWQGRSLSKSSSTGASPDRLRRPAIFGPGCSVPMIRRDDVSLDHHRSDSGRSTGSSRSNTTGESLFLTNSSRSVRHGASAGRALVPTRPGPALVRSSSVSTEANATLHSDLNRRESWASTTPTSPDEEEAPQLKRKDSEKSKAVPQHPIASAAVDEARDDFGPFWKSSDYSYGRAPLRCDEKSLPPLMLSDAPIPPSRSQSLDPLAVPLDGEDLASPIRSDAPSWPRPPLPGVLPEHSGSSTTDTTFAVAGGVGASPSLSESKGRFSVSPHTEDRQPSGGRLAGPLDSQAASVETSAHSTAPIGQVVAARLTPPTYSDPPSERNVVDPRTDRHASSSSLSNPSMPPSPNARYVSNPPISATSGASQTSKSLRSAISRSAKSFRNSLLWSAHPEHGLGVYTTFDASHSLTPSPMSSLAPSPQVPSLNSLTPYSPTRSDFSASVLSSREDVSSASPPVELSSKSSNRSHSSFLFRGSSKPKPDRSANARSQPGPYASSSQIAVVPEPSKPFVAGSSPSNLTASVTSLTNGVEEVLGDHKEVRHTRSRSRFSTRFSFHDQGWTRTLTSMAAAKKVGAEGSKNNRKVDAVNSATRTEAERTDVVGSGPAGMQRGRSQSAGQLQQMFANDAAGASSVVSPGTDHQETAAPGKSREVKLSLAVPASPLSDCAPSPDPQISPNFAASFSFLNRALWTDNEESLVFPADGDQGGPTPTQTVPVVALGGPTADSAVPMLLMERQPAVASVAALPGSEEPQTGPAAASLLSSESSSKLAAGLSPPVRNAIELPAVRHGSNPTTKAQKKGHRKQQSLDPVTLITTAAKEAAASIDARAKIGDVGILTPRQRSTSNTGGMTASTTMASYLTASSSALLSPADEALSFFDALTSPSAGDATPSAEQSLAQLARPTETGGEYFPAVPAAADVVTVPDAATSSASAAHRRHRSLSRTLSVVLDPRAKSRPPSVKEPGSPVRSAFDAAEPPRAARPETSLGFSFRKALRRERKLSSEHPVPPLRALSSISSGQPDTLHGARGGVVAPRLGTTSTSASSPNRANGVTAARSSPSKANRTPSKTITRSPTSVSSIDAPITPNKLRVVSDSASPLSLRSRSPGKAMSPPSSYRAPLSKPQMATSTPQFSSGQRTTLRSTAAAPRQPRANLAAISPPTMDRYAAVDEPSPKMQSRIAATRSPKSMRSSARSVSDKSLASSSSASTITSRNGEAKKKATSAKAARPTAAGPQPMATAARAAARRERTKSKPSLPSVKTSPDSVAKALPPRSYSSLDFRGAAAASRRKMSQPTLDIADDKEFLEALEQVRAVNRERIAAEAAEAEKQARLAKLGMLSGLHLKAKAESDSQTGGDMRGRTLSRPASNASMASRRSVSADARLSPPAIDSNFERKSVDEVQKAIMKANADRKPVLTTAVSGLEWGVGKASGKLRDGAFVNDDDWKKEVKALFLIRELVQTERSYARHLASLLTVVKRLSTSAALTASTAKRKSGSLFATYSPSNMPKAVPGALPHHLATLRTFLPQLIALSRGLINRVEANPTSAGVGAAFEVLGAQLQATFVNWSSVVPTLMEAVRAIEGSKSKGALKLGLIPLLPPDQTEVGAATSPSLVATSQPTSPIRSNAVVRPLGSSPDAQIEPATGFGTSMLPPPVPAKHERRDSEGQSASKGGTRSGQRRSTITSATFAPPAPASLLGSKPAAKTRPTSPSNDRGLPSRPSSPWGQLASLTMPRNSAKPPADSPSTPHATPVGLIAPQVPPPSTNVAATTSSTATAAVVKSLSPMDIVIMPTQRLPRYGLMLRDLLSNTPPQSLSHARVQRALASIQRVTLLCDAASNSSHGAGSGSGSSSSGVGKATAGTMAAPVATTGSGSGSSAAARMALTPVSSAVGTGARR